MLIDFLKMHAQGNDFVILDGLEQALPELDYPSLAKDICARKYGVGADGLVLLLGSATHSARMIIYNNDGSRAKMCGSALRCVALLISRKLGTNALSIETDSGIRTAELIPDGSGTLIRVNMGKPVILEVDKQVGNFTGSLVDVGNLHFVVYTETLEDDPHLRFGAMLEHHPAFPATVNVHFARRISASEIEIRIWENAVGATLACGTGATASVCTGIGQQSLEDSVMVNMPGGRVRITRLSPGEEYLLSGEVSEIGNGTYIWKT